MKLERITQKFIIFGGSLLFLTNAIFATDGFGELKDSRSSLCLMSSDSRILLGACNGSDETLWSYDRDNKLIKSKISNMCIGVNNIKSNSLLQLQICEKNSNLQKWELDRTNNMIKLKEAVNLVADAYGDNIGANVGLWEYHGGKNQQWSISNIDSNPPISSSIVKITDQYATLFPGHTMGTWRNQYAFAAIKKDSTVVSWGKPSCGGDISKIQNQLKNVKKVFSSICGFIALKNDNTVVTWNPINSETRSKLTDVKDIFSTLTAFAVLKNDGTIVALGNDKPRNEDTKNIKTVYTNSICFAGLKNDGTVVTWGLRNYCENKTYFNTDLRRYIDISDKLTNVSRIFSTTHAFAALKDDGTVVTWGNYKYGGRSDAVRDKLTNVKMIYSNYDAFAALKDNGTVVTWSGEHSNYGWDVQNQLNNVKTIYSTTKAFAALKHDGTVVTWGDNEFGGNSSTVKDKLTDIKTITSSFGAFAALKNDGTVVTWGSPSFGGDSSHASGSLRDITAIYATESAFAGVTKNGTVVTWGNTIKGGDASSVSADLQDVKTIYSTLSMFTALKYDGSTVIWGETDIDPRPLTELKNTVKNIKEIYSSYSLTKNDTNYYEMRPLSAKFGQLRDFRTSLCMTISNTTNLDGAKVVLDMCNGSDKMMWRYDKNSKFIKSKLNNDYCLSAYNGVYYDRLITVKKCGTINSDFQQWDIDKGRNMIYSHKNNYFVMDAYDRYIGSSVGIWGIHGGLNQKWSVRNILED